MPNGNSALVSSREMECARGIVRHRAKAEFRATDEVVVELHGKRPVWRTDDAVSSSIVPTAYCELECAESCERVSADFPYGDNIFTEFTATEVCDKISCNLQL